jgi:hypothetical protein
MNDEKKTPGEDQEEPDNEVDYIDAINKLRETTVSKEAYNKLRKENKDLISALANGQSIEIDTKNKPDITTLRKELYGKGKELNNLEYVDKTLQLRKAIIEAGGSDPFLPTGDHVKITPQMIDTAETVAEILEECVEFAEGDSGIFTSELQRRMKDTTPIYNRRR